MILPTPFITRHIIDDLIPQKNITGLAIWLSIGLFVLLITKFLTFVQFRLFFKLNNLIIIDIKTRLIKKITKLEYKIRKKYSTGYLMARINNDPQQLSALFADSIVRIIEDILTFFIGLIAMFYLNWKLTILTILLLPFYVIASIYFSKKIREESDKSYEKYALVNQKLEQALSLTKICSYLLKRAFPGYILHKALKKEYNASYTLVKTTSLNFLISGTLTGFAPFIVIGFGAYQIIQGDLTIGSLIAFESLTSYLFGPTNSLINANVEIQKAITALKRVKEILALKEEPIVKNVEKYLEINTLEFNNIDFSYENDKNILQNFSLKANKGEKIGLIGKSGCGKTTILNILTGLYEINNGEIKINDKKLDYHQIIALRYITAVVEQEPILINDTIFNNIKFGNPKASKQDIIRAAKQANADEFITELTDGYETKVSFNGSNLSVGQKQRIAIARALVRNPKILFLDEATSNIDTISEKKISESINNLPKDMIVIIVAHRLSTIRDCDKIVILDEGRIIESGNHKELVNINGKYNQLLQANLN